MRVPKVVALAARTVGGLAAHSPRAGRVAGLGLPIGLLVGLGAARRSLASHTRAPAAPSRLTARAEGAAVRLRWHAPAHGRVSAFRIERGGRSVAGRPATRRTYADTHVRPGHAYRYAVRALGRGGARSALSPAVRVTVPAGASRSPAGAGAPGGGTGTTGASG